MNSVGLCYYRRINDELQIGVDLERNFTLGESVAQIGYHMIFQKQTLQWKVRKKHSGGDVQLIARCILHC